MKPPALTVAALCLMVALWWFFPGPTAPLSAPSPQLPGPRSKSQTERLNDALRDTNRTRRSARFATVWSGMTAEEAAAMAPELLAHESESLFQNDWLEFLRLWGTLDPRAALQFTEAHAGSKTADWQDAIVRGWITLDPAAAADWWLTGAVDERKNLGGLIVSRWVETEWMAAAAWIKARVPSAEQPGLAQAFASALARHHPEEATSLVEAAHQRLFPPDFIETSVFQDLARTRPLHWVTSLRDTFTLGTPIIERLATEKDLPDPGGWFLRLMKPENLPSAVRTYQSAGLRDSDSLVAGLDRAAGPFVLRGIEDTHSAGSPDFQGIPRTEKNGCLAFFKRRHFCLLTAKPVVGDRASVPNRADLSLTWPGNRGALTGTRM